MNLSGESLLTRSGNTISAEDYLKGKRALALYFSAHWCPPCRQFTPVLARAYAGACENGVAPGQVGLVFVSSDRSLADQRAYMHEAHGDWPAVMSGSPLVA